MAVNGGTIVLEGLFQVVLFAHLRGHPEASSQRLAVFGFRCPIIFGRETSEAVARVARGVERCPLRLCFYPRPSFFLANDELLEDHGTTKTNKDLTAGIS